LGAKGKTTTLPEIEQAIGLKIVDPFDGWDDGKGEDSYGFGQEWTFSKVASPPPEYDDEWDDGWDRPQYVNGARPAIATPDAIHIGDSTDYHMDIQDRHRIPSSPLNSYLVLHPHGMAELRSGPPLNKAQQKQLKAITGQNWQHVEDDPYEDMHFGATWNPFKTVVPPRPTPEEAAQGRMCTLHPNRPAVRAEGFAAMCEDCAHHRDQVTKALGQGQTPPSAAHLYWAKTASWIPPVLYHWTEARNAPYIHEEGLRPCYLTSDSDVNNLNADIPAMEVPFRVTVDTSSLSPEAFGFDENTGEGYGGTAEQAHAASGNTYYKLPIPPSAIIEMSKQRPHQLAY